MKKSKIPCPRITRLPDRNTEALKPAGTHPENCPDDCSRRPLIPLWKGEGDPEGLLQPDRKLLRCFDLRELGYEWTPSPIRAFDVTLLLVRHADTQEPAGFVGLYFDKLGLVQITPSSFLEILGTSPEPFEPTPGAWPA